MKVVINRCFGGFSLSPPAMQRMAELQGRKCYFFKDGHTSSKPYQRIPKGESLPNLFFTAFDVPNPNTPKFAYDKHVITSRPENRSDPLLIQVIEELGAAGASGSCADLKIVEIPDGIEYEISEYDGLEHIAEKHRTWS